MLLRFGASNHLSLRERQELSLVASPLRDNEAGLISSVATPNQRVLPAAMIYGPNASGKSNVVAALSYMRDAVLHSHLRGGPGRLVPRMPFALDKGCAERRTCLDVDFVVGDVRYSYAFSCTQEAITEESLHGYPRGHRQVLFERLGQDFTFGRALRGRNKVIADLTRPDSLFMSTATQNGHEALSHIVQFFQSMRLDATTDANSIFISRLLAENNVDQRSIEFLRALGTGVTSYRLSEEETTEFSKKLGNLLSDHFREQAPSVAKIFSDSSQSTRPKIELAHQSHGEDDVYFSLDRESLGTRRLLSFLSHALRALDEGGLLVVDEFDAGLHTQACEALMAMFALRETNPKGAQFIGTTHDTNLLHSSLLRRDQVWFTEKDAGGATHLYALSDIHTRKGDNIERGYLQGRFGAIPFSGSVTNLITGH